MKRLWSTLLQAPEYFFLLVILARSPFRPFAAPLLLFGIAYVVYLRAKEQKKNNPPALALAVYAYYAGLFYLAYFLFKINFSLNWLFTTAFSAGILYCVRWKKLPLKFAFILFLVCTGVLLTLLRGTERHHSADTRKALNKEKYAKLLIASDTNLPAAAHYNRVIKDKSLPIRNIYIDEEEKYLYFTTVPPNQDYRAVYPAVFKAPLANLSDFQFIRYAYCNNLVHDKKRKQFYLPVRMRPEILVVDPESFKIKKHIRVPTPHNALVLFLDSKNDRLIGIPEGGQIWLYDLQEKKYIKTDRALYNYAGGMMDDAASKFYALSYLGPYLLKEYNADTLQCTRKILGFLEPSWSMSYNPARRFFYVAGFFSGKIHVISEPDFQQTGVLNVKPGIRPVVVDTLRNVIYAGNYLQDTMYVLNNDGNILGEFFVGKRCRSIVIAPRSRRVFAGTSLGVLEVDVDAFLDYWKKNVNK